MKHLHVAHSLGQGMILATFCYLFINFSQLVTWFRTRSQDVGELGGDGVCPSNLRIYLLYDSVSSFVFFLLSGGIIASAMSSKFLEGRWGTVGIITCEISAVCRMGWNGIACYWIDTYPVNCRNTLIYKMALASVILFFVLNIPVIAVHSRLIVEKALLSCKIWLAEVPVENLPPGINLQECVNNSKFSDVQIFVGGQIFHAHKIILSSRCVYFEKLLASGMKESQQTDPIILSEILPETFSMILFFMYTNNIPGLPKMEVDSIIELMKFSDKYAYDDLKNYLEINLQYKKTLDNLITILYAAHKYNFLRTKKIAMHLLDSRNNKFFRKDFVGWKEESSDLSIFVSQ